MFRGDWVDDHATGRGALHYANGNVYEGGWLMDRCVARGCWVLCSEGGWLVDCCFAGVRGGEGRVQAHGPECGRGGEGEGGGRLAARE